MAEDWHFSGSGRCGIYCTRTDRISLVGLLENWDSTWIGNGTSLCRLLEEAIELDAKGEHLSLIEAMYRASQGSSETYIQSTCFLVTFYFDSGQVRKGLQEISRAMKSLNRAEYLKVLRHALPGIIERSDSVVAEHLIQQLTGPERDSQDFKHLLAHHRFNLDWDLGKTRLTFPGYPLPGPHLAPMDPYRYIRPEEVHRCQVN